MLGFYGPMGQCFGRFPTVSQRSGGGGGGGGEGVREEERYGIH